MRTGFTSARRAAGDAIAMGKISLMHTRGLGVPKNVAKAKAWFKKAANAGDPQAKKTLANWRAVAPAPAQKK